MGCFSFFNYRLLTSQSDSHTTAIKHYTIHPKNLITTLLLPPTCVLWTSLLFPLLVRPVVPNWDYVLILLLLYYLHPPSKTCMMTRTCIIIATISIFYHSYFLSTNAHFLLRPINDWGRGGLKNKKMPSTILAIIIFNLLVFVQSRLHALNSEQVTYHLLYNFHSTLYMVVLRHHLLLSRRYSSWNFFILDMIMCYFVFHEDEW